jgi:fructose-bisphosphate aldolase class II
MAEDYLPVPGTHVFRALHEQNCIVMATNVRIFPGIGQGIFRAAKDMDAAIILEIAKSESDLAGGYTGMTPAMYAQFCMDAAKQVKHDIWVLHADHITIKKGDPVEIDSVKKHVDAQIDAGFTSFAIDASHLFDFKGKDLREEMALNIDATTKIAKHIHGRMGSEPFGLEVEVGEIGKEDQHGRVLTRPEEAVVFIDALHENGVDPDVLAIANGSAHGNTYDAQGNMVEQVSIDIPQTISVAKALKDKGWRVRIAQHGITGTPRDLIATKFPKGDIIKGNVATFYQNMVYDLLKVYDPSLFQDIWNWTMKKYADKNKGKAPNEIFGTNVKNAAKQFYKELYNQPEDFIKACEDMSYAETMVWLKAFNNVGTAKRVREYLKTVPKVTKKRTPAKSTGNVTVHANLGPAHEPGKYDD